MPRRASRRRPHPPRSAATTAGGALVLQQEPGILLDLGGFGAAGEKLPSAEILDRLARRHVQPSWMFFRELRVGTGFAKLAQIRLDAWALATWPSLRYERITYEVKISRSDWLREMAHPEKRRMGLHLSNRFYFVTPPNLVKVAEVPAECGLIEIGGAPDRIAGTFTIAVEAPWRDTPGPSWAFLASLVRHATNPNRPVGPMTP